MEYKSAVTKNRGLIDVGFTSALGKGIKQPKQKVNTQQPIRSEVNLAVAKDV